MFLINRTYVGHLLNCGVSLIVSFAPRSRGGGHHQTLNISVKFWWKKLILVSKFSKFSMESDWIVFPGTLWSPGLQFTTLCQEEHFFVPPQKLKFLDARAYNLRTLHPILINLVGKLWLKSPLLDGPYTYSLGTMFIQAHNKIHNLKRCQLRHVPITWISSALHRIHSS